MPQCANCGGMRVISSSALTSLSIAHIDCDAFFAAVEKRDNPELRDKPVIIGGGHRGVVATCCYIARLHGVRSAMPMFKALKACPNAVVVRPDSAKYRAASADIRAKMSDLTPLVQMVSIDEAYLDLSGTERINGGAPAQVLAKLALEIERDVGITVSIGLSSNRFLAKTASEMDKPRGFAVIDPAEAPAILAPLATGAPHGIDNRPVRIDTERKSVSAERTFNEDISSLTLLEDRLWSVCEETAIRAKKAGTQGRVVTLKLKTRDFRSLTRSVTLPGATQLAQTLFRAARPILARETQSGIAYRLIGIGISSLEPATSDEIDLVDPTIAKRAAAERAGDKAREKFGKDAIQTARGMRMSVKDLQKRD